MTFGNQFRLCADDVPEPFGVFTSWAHLPANPTATTLILNYRHPSQVGETPLAESDILIPSPSPAGARARGALEAVPDGGLIGAVLSVQPVVQVPHAKTMRADLWLQDFAPDFIHNNVRHPTRSSGFN